MTFVAENRHWLEAYVRDMQERMGLSHWRIALSDEYPVNGNCVAEIHINGDARRGEIRLCDPEGDMDDLRDSVVHELMHCHLHDMEHVFDGLSDHVNPAAWHLASQQFSRQQEVAICAVTRAWAATMPLPAPKKARKAA